MAEQTDDNTPYIVLFGDLRDGVNYAVGPFASKKDAAEWADDYANWVFVRLEKPE